MTKVWEAYGGIMTIRVAPRRNGKPRAVVAIQVIQVMSAADAKAVTKQNPQLKFVERAAEVRSTGTRKDNG